MRFIIELDDDNGIDQGDTKHVCAALEDTLGDLGILVADVRLEMGARK